MGPIRIFATERHFPQQRSRSCIQRQEISVADAGEEQVGRRRQNSAVGRIAELEFPLPISGSGIDRAHGGVHFLFHPIVERLPSARHAEADAGRHDAAVCATCIEATFHVLGITLRKNRRGVFPGIHVEEPGARAERRTEPVRAALIAGVDERAFPACQRIRRHDRPATVESRVPILPDERLPNQELARQPIEHIEKAIALGRQNHFSRFALPRYVGQERNLHRVPVELVVRVELVVPLQRAGVGIEGHDRAGVEVVTGSHVAVVVRTGIADAPVREVGLRIVGSRHPDRPPPRIQESPAPGVATSLARPCNRIEAPGFLTRGCIVCRQ